MSSKKEAAPRTGEVTAAAQSLGVVKHAKVYCTLVVARRPQWQNDQCFMPGVAGIIFEHHEGECPWAYDVNNSFHADAKDLQGFPPRHADRPGGDHQQKPPSLSEDLALLIYRLV